MNVYFQHIFPIGKSMLTFAKKKLQNSSMLTWKGITKKFLRLYVIQLVSLMNVFLWYFQMLEVPNKNVYVVNTFDRLFEKLSLTVSLVYLLMKQLKAFCHNIFINMNLSS